MEAKAMSIREQKLDADDPYGGQKRAEQSRPVPGKQERAINVLSMEAAAERTCTIEQLWLGAAELPQAEDSDLTKRSARMFAKLSCSDPTE